MGFGGGVRVCIAMANAFEEISWNPVLVALRGYDTRLLSQIHGLNLKRTKMLYFLGYGSALRIPFPTQVRLLTMFLRKAIRTYKPDVLIFHDDIPKLEENSLKDVQVILYSHFPYAARLKFNVTDVCEISCEREIQRILNVTYRKLLRDLIYVDRIPRDTKLVANSTVTKIFMEKLWGKKVEVIFPPLITQVSLRRPKTKKNYLVVLAALQPNKRIGEVIKAFSLLKNRDSKMFIIGYQGHDYYLDYLVDVINKLGIKQRITFLINASEKIKWHILEKSKVIVSAANFEPFGINVIEGMYMGNIPIVYKSAISGPWIDIIDKGKYGLGFKHKEELADLVDKILTDEVFGKHYSELAFNRSNIFSYVNFKKDLLNILL